MTMSINTNVSSLIAQRNLTNSQMSLQTSMQRLSSGLRINSSKDDAAGLAISERMSSQIRGLDQAVRNANDGISLSQTADGAMASASDMLQRIRELAVQSANATNSPSDRQALNNEVNQLTSELDRLSQTSQFNGQTLFDGSFGTAVFQVGANANQTITTATANLRTNNYGNNNVAGTTAAGVITTTGAWAANSVTSGSITVSGYAGSQAVPVVANSTAQTIAQNINSYTTNTGVTATAETDVALTFGTIGAYSLQLQSDNGTTPQSVSFTLSAVSGANALSAAVAAINDQTSKTGITAVANAAATGITLTNANGNDIRVSTTAGIANAGAVTVQKLDSTGATNGAATSLAATTTAAAALTSGFLVLDSSKSFATVSTSTALASSSSVLQTVASLDVTTVAGSNTAIKIVDSALSAITGERAKFGALQSRFSQTVSSLQVTSNNLSASRSRIQDADFAAETANLSRTQILQQAGTAMVAQANQLPQGVLSLLK